MDLSNKFSGELKVMYTYSVQFLVSSVCFSSFLSASGACCSSHHWDVCVCIGLRFQSAKDNGFIVVAK